MADHPADHGSLLDLPVRELLDAAAARTPAPGGGGAAALTAALAAALTGMAARFADGAAYGAYLAARRRPRDDPGRADAIAAARRETVGVPARITELAGEVAGIAAELARSGNPNLHGDATAAVHLAAAAATTAAELIAANVTDDPKAGDTGEAQRDRAREIAAGARALAEAALTRGAGRDS